MPSFFPRQRGSGSDIHLIRTHRAAWSGSGSAIYDTIQMIVADVATYCIGMSASMAAVLLASGTASACAAELACHDPSRLIRLPRHGARYRGRRPRDHQFTTKLTEIMAQHTGHLIGSSATLSATTT